MGYGGSSGYAGDSGASTSVTFAAVQTALAAATGAVGVNGQALTSVASVARTTAAQSIEVSSGDGVTPGSTAPGDINLKVGTPVSSISGAVRVITQAGALIGHLRSIAGVYFELINGAGASGGTYVRSTSAMQVEGTTVTTVSATGGDVWVQPSTGILRGYTGSALSMLWTWGTTVAQSITMQIRAGTGANAGNPFDVTAQAGQAQTGGAANNNGGIMRSSSGPAGTGGSGGAGVDGDWIARTGTTERVRAAGSGATLALTATTVTLSNDIAVGGDIVVVSGVIDTDDEVDIEIGTTLAADVRISRDGFAVRLGGVPIVPEYTVAGVPSAATFDNGVIIVSNEVGGRTLATSNGTNWCRVSDGAIISS